MISSKCQASANHHTGITEDFPGIELTGQSLKIVEKFCYLGGTIGATGGSDDVVITRTRSEGSKFSNLVPLVTWFALKGKKCIIFYMCL